MTEQQIIAGESAIVEKLRAQGLLPAPAACSEFLLPCPFCGNSKPELIEVSTPDHWRVGCSKCGSYNNISRGREAALNRWNRRHQRILDDCPGDVIAAYADGTVVLDDGLDVWNPVRALAFIADGGQLQNANLAGRRSEP